MDLRRARNRRLLSISLVSRGLGTIEDCQKGIAWLHDARYCRSAFRLWFGPGFGCYYIGFRVLLCPDGQGP